MNTRRVKLIALLWWVLPDSLLATGIGDMTVTSYINTGDKAGAADLLQTVLSSGAEAQREHAQSLLDSLE